MRVVIKMHRKGFKIAIFILPLHTQKREILRSDLVSEGICYNPKKTFSEIESSRQVTLFFFVIVVIKYYYIIRIELIVNT